MKIPKQVRKCFGDVFEMRKNGAPNLYVFYAWISPKFTYFSWKHTYLCMFLLCLLPPQPPHAYTPIHKGGPPAFGRRAGLAALPGTRRTDQIYRRQRANPAIQRGRFQRWRTLLSSKIRHGPDPRSRWRQADHRLRQGRRKTGHRRLRIQALT